VWSLSLLPLLTASFFTSARRSNNVLCGSAPLPLCMSFSSLAKSYPLTTNDFCQKPTALFNL
jgi:hypothetical protein